jgi:hypothetical protein
MTPDSPDYFSFLQDEIARARAERDLAVATLILDNVERFVDHLVKAIIHATRAHR